MQNGTSKPLFIGSDRKEIARATYQRYFNPEVFLGDTLKLLSAIAPSPWNVALLWIIRGMWGQVYTTNVSNKV